MKRTSLVLAVVAAMVTVLVFAAPAFAQDECIGSACPAGPSASPLDRPIHTDLETTPPDVTPGGAADLTNGVTCGDQVAGEALLITALGGPPGFHLLAQPGDLTPGDFIQGAC